MKNITLLLIVFSNLLYGQISKKWTQTFNNVSGRHPFDLSRSMAVDNNGNSLILGQTNEWVYSSNAGANLGGAVSTYLLKYDNNGNLLWKKDIPFYKPKPVQVITDGLGNVYCLLAYSDGSFFGNALVIKMDASGNILWHNFFTSSSSASLAPLKIELDNASNVYLSGNSNYSSGNGLTYLKYSPSGAQQWIKYLGQAYKGTNMQVDSAGTIYLCGSRNSDAYTGKYDASGTMIWESFANPFSTGSSLLSAITTDTAGNVYSGGFVSTGTANGDDFLTIKYSSSGSQAWLKTYNTTYNNDDSVRVIGVDTAGNVFASGSSGTQQITIKYDANGNQKWAQPYAGTGGSPRAFPIDLLCYNNNVYIVSLFNTLNGSYSTNDMVLIKYNQSGGAVWNKIDYGDYIETGSATGVKHDGSGNIIATGYVNHDNTNTDLVTTKYDINGNVLWKKIYDGDRVSIDNASTAVVDHSGNLLVAATSQDTTQSNLGFVSLITKYDSLGNRLWYSTVGAGYTESFSNSVTCDNGDNAYLLSTANNKNDFVISKFTPAGANAWSTIIPSPNCIGKKILIDNSQNVIAAGGFNFGSRGFLMKLNKQNGDTIWTRQTSFGTSYDTIADIAVDKLDNIYIVHGGSFLVTKYDPNGNILWNTPASGICQVAPPNQGASIAINKQNELLVKSSGSTGYPPNLYYSITAKLNTSSGVTIFSDTLCAGTGNVIDNLQVPEVVADSAANTYVTDVFYSYSTPGYKLVVRKLSPTGTLLWKKQCTKNGTFDILSFTYSGNGSVYLGGTYQDSNGPSGHLLYSFDALGTKKDSLEYNDTLFMQTKKLVICNDKLFAVSNDGKDIILDCYNTAAGNVWPGDANSDGTADNTDVLELGLHYTQTGPARASVSNAWQSYHANNWTGTITNGQNLNHSDCNGDGVIDANDTLAIYNNYGLVHAFKAANTTTVNPQLSIVPDQQMVDKGQWGTASIYLGEVSAPINNINGIAFTVTFDHTLLEPNSVYLEYPSSFIDVGQNLHFRKTDFNNGLIYTATTHTNNINVNGYGKIAILHYRIKTTLTQDAVLNIGLSTTNQGNASGILTPLTTGTATLMAIGATVGIDEISETNTAIYPNPAANALNITSSLGLQKAELTDVMGNLVLSEKLSGRNGQLQVSGLANGIYFIKVYSDNRVIKNEKIVVQR